MTRYIFPLNWSQRSALSDPPESQREFQSERDLLIERLLQRRLREGETPEANIRWGAKGSFDNLNGTEFSGGISVNLQFDDEQPPEKITRQYNEIKRKYYEEEVRVENPDDPEQYVMVQHMEFIVFDGPDGICRQFNLNFPSS